MNLLFDVGRGTFHRLWQSGLSRNDIDAVFLTHLHSDHIVGLPDLFVSGATLDTVVKGLVARPFVIYGPGATTEAGGTSEMMSGIKKAYRPDTIIRESEQGQPMSALDVLAHDVKPGVVYERQGVRVTAFAVDHGAIHPAFGYRIDYGGRSVVLSGDTNYKPDEPLMQMAQDADVIIHEVLMLGENFREKHPAAAKSIGEKHTFPAEVGNVFTQSRPKLGVFTHIEWIYDESDDDRDVVSDILKETRKSYSGPVLLGEDLDRIVISQKGVVVERSSELLPISSN
ncbi:MBL fold metallo-hydrolase [Pseudomonas asiatica]